MVVGLLVEPVLNVVAGASSTSVTPSDGSDFAINDLFFKVRPTNDTPYQRATAQFHKDQLDTGQAAGDQSLTGWWTRGQFSFHKGSGVTYYEVSEGTLGLTRELSILERFNTGDGLDPFKPGKVTCQKAWTGPTAAAGVTRVKAVGSYLIAQTNGTLSYGASVALGSTYTPAGAAQVRSFAVSPTLAYALLDNGKVASFDPATATETTLYTGLTTTGRGIWYVKGRLLISDSNGKWYQLATNPATPPQAVASTDVIFTGSDWATSSTVADSPGPILVGNSNRIFALSLDATGSIPTLSAPVQVGEFPPGEIVCAIAYHLGFATLVTSAGVRIGVVADNGQVTYGPLLIERASPGVNFITTEIARYSTRVAVVIDHTIYEIDLSQQVDNRMEFAYIGRGTPFTGATTSGVTTYLYSTQIAWQQDKVFYTATNPMAGSLTTGLHRYNTLEPKRFDSVRVHGSGTAGTIGVSRVDADGTETSLYTIDMGTSHVEEIPLGLTTATEAEALKFTLTPSGSVSPTLLGYQLRALPEPQRQRMIRVPLLLDDVERRQPGRAVGRKGSAWTRLAALEDLETTNPVVTYRDFRTGETGRAYLESVELSNTTPPSATSKGFGGGVLFVTLRKL